MEKIVMEDFESNMNVRLWKYIVEFEDFVLRGKELRLLEREWRLEIYFIYNFMEIVILEMEGWIEERIKEKWIGIEGWIVGMLVLFIEMEKMGNRWYKNKMMEIW